MPFDPIATSTVAPPAGATFTTVDRTMHGAVAELTAGLSPIAAATAYLDWLAHLSLSPGKQAELALQAGEEAARLADLMLRGGAPCPGTPAAPSGDRRFASEDWHDWPFNMMRQAYLASEKWWGSATEVRGLSRRNQRLVKFAIAQMLHAFSPRNFLLTNPDLVRTTLRQRGHNLQAGAQNLATDMLGSVLGKHPVDEGFVVGRNLAATPGRVVLRNALMELIQYEPTTPSVFPEPVLIVPAWIMKYYILDLQPHNSLIKFLVDRGHTVFAISWKNPTSEHRDLGMDDYRRLGIMAALGAIAEVLPGRKTHACGYCLGGTLLSIAAAAMARDGDDRLASMTLFAAQTDFADPGELKLFITDTALSWLDGMMATTGYLDGSRMGGAFQLLRADDLVWSPFVRRYLLGETDHPNDLMVWNADQTRMPHRMHSEYLHGLFLHNDLAQGRCVVGDRPVALCDIGVPIFALGTSHDHVAPWRSVFKINLFTRSEVTFVLTSGGHNAGVVSEPGHRGRSYQMLTKELNDRYVDPDTWSATAPRHEGSWWPQWQSWLAARSGEATMPPVLANALCDAPGTYILER
jgi:poly[(R)-3-hydroxyalkanoate] polymerase subunit PhaC